MSGPVSGWYDLEVARALQPIDPRTGLPEPTKLEKAVLTLLAEGQRPPEIAKRLAKGDKALAKRLRQKVWKMVRSDALFQARIEEAARGEMALGLVGAGRGLAKRASRRTDAARLLLEVTGVHVPHQRVEHSGDITIKMDLPRPRAVEATADDIPDATVVADPPAV